MLKTNRRTKETWDIENKKSNGRCKSNYISNNIKCEWIKQSNFKTDCQIGFKKHDLTILSKGYTVHSRKKIDRK